MCGCYEDVWARPEKCKPNAYPSAATAEGFWAECGLYPHEEDSEKEVYKWKIIDLRNLPACYHERLPEFQRTAYDFKSKGQKGELRFPECRSQQRTAECVKASLAATWELCELSFWGRAAIPTRGVLGPPLHLIDDPPLFPPRSSCQPLCRAIWSPTPHPSPPRGISILV